MHDESSSSPSRMCLGPYVRERRWRDRIVLAMLVHEAPSRGADAAWAMAHGDFGASLHIIDYLPCLPLLSRCTNFVPCFYIGYVIHWLLTTGIEPFVAVARSATRRLATTHNSAYLLEVM